MYYSLLADFIIKLQSIMHYLSVGHKILIFIINDFAYHVNKYCIIFINIFIYFISYISNIIHEIFIMTNLDQVNRLFYCIITDFAYHVYILTILPYPSLIDYLLAEVRYLHVFEHQHRTIFEI